MRGLRIFEARRARELRREQPRAEQIVWRALRNRALNGHKFVRQEPIGPYFADFACREARLVVEIDGATHSTDAEVAHDAARTRHIEALGYRVLRAANDDVRRNLSGVLETILAMIEGRDTL